MGPPASTAFILIGVALLLSTGSRSSRRLAGWLGLWVVILSALPLVGYWYGASELYSFARLTGIALQTAVIIAALAVGVVLSIPEWGIVTMIKSNDGGGIMFRRLLLPLIAISLMLGWMRVAGEHAGLYDTAFGTAIRTIFELTLLTGLLWWTANGISRAEEKVCDADRRKDEFLAVLSHELRNPLAPIRNAVDILKTAGTDEPRPQAAREMIERQVDHLVRLIDDLLDVNRITRNKIDLQSETLDMGSLVRRLTESLLDHRQEASVPAFRSSERTRFRPRRPNTAVSDFHKSVEQRRQVHWSRRQYLGDRSSLERKRVDIRPRRRHWNSKRQTRQHLQNVLTARPSGR